MWRDSIARVVVIREGSDGTPDLAHLESELLKYRQDNVPMIGSFSAGSNVTGIRSPVRSICKLLHQSGAYAFFDYAGVGGYVKVDMKGDEGDDSSSMDAAFFSPHKFIGGPGSSGLLIARNILFRKAFDIKTSKASTAGGGTIDYVNRRNHKYSKDIEFREDAGTPGILQAIKAGLAFKVKEMVGVEKIEKLEHVHCTLALNAWRSNPLIALMGADRVSYQFATRRVSIFSFNLLSPVPTSQVAEPRRKSPTSLAAPETPETTDSSPRDIIATHLAHYANVGNVEAASSKIPLHHYFVIALLNDVYGIQGRGGCSCAGPYGHDMFGMSSLRSCLFMSPGPAFKIGWARVNFNYFISQHEVSFIIEAVKQIAQHGWRLLPQYVQDLESGQFIHRSCLDANGKKLETSPDDTLFSINDLTLSNNTKPARGDDTGVRVTFRKPEDPKKGERSRTSYRKTLKDATTIYKKAAANAKKGGAVRDFLTDFSGKIKPGDVWWLLPTQAASFLDNRDALLTDPAYDAESDGVTNSSVSLVLKKGSKEESLSFLDNSDALLTDTAYNAESDGVANSSVPLVLKKGFKGGESVGLASRVPKKSKDTDKNQNQQVLKTSKPLTCSSEHTHATHVGSTISNRTRKARSGGGGYM
jgi:selenocysteine lyase/cysteine desulfurase